MTYHYNFFEIRHTCKQILGRLGKSDPPITMQTELTWFIYLGIYTNNGEESYVNMMLDGCVYPGEKLVQFITLSEKHNVNNS
jgi:hypothetical protein